MRVLMAVPDRRVRGGPPSHLYLLRDTLIERGVDVRSFVFGGRSPHESALAKIAGRLWDVVSFPWLLARARPDIVQLNSAFDRKGVARDVFFVVICFVLRAKLVVKFHGSDLPFLRGGSRFWRLLAAAVVRGATMICVLSEEERAAFAVAYPGVRIEVVKNALDFTRYSPSYDFRARYGIPDGVPLLLFVARFIRSKGLTEVLEALALLRETMDVRAALVGDGETRSEMEGLAARLGLGDATTFTGYIPEDDTVAAYCSADVLVFPTYHQEGMPMVIFHSLAAGLPIITTHIRAAADWLEEPDNVVFVPPRDASALADAVRDLLQEPARAKQMRESGRRVAALFDRRSVAEEFEALYRSLLETSPGAGAPAEGGGGTGPGSSGPGDTRNLEA